MRVKICVRAEWSPVLTFSTKGELQDSASSSGRKLRRPLHTAIARSGPLIADVDVEPEAVVAPDDVAQELVVAAVVRRVDDALLLPGAPGVGAGGSERDADRGRELGELGAPLAETRGGLVEVVAAAGADLDLGGDQLADEVLLERRAHGCSLEILEPVGQPQRLGVEDRELFLDGEREVLRLLVLLAGGTELLLRAEVLGVYHGALH